MRPRARRDAPTLSDAREEASPVDDEPRWVSLEDGAGHVLAQGRTVGGVPDGPWLFLGSGGQRLAQGVFQAGVAHGEWHAWHPDGTKRGSQGVTADRIRVNYLSLPSSSTPSSRGAPPKP